MKCIVGYEPTPQGIDAIALGIDLARALRIDLDIVVVLRRHDIFSLEYPPSGDASDIMTAQACTWLKEALSQVPDDVQVRGHIYSGATIADGLRRAADKLNVAMIVVGGASTSPLKRHQVGTVAGDLLYESAVPVALAPRGYQTTPITRVNCTVGTRIGAGSLVREGLYIALRSRLPLRLVALVDDDNAEFARTNTAEILSTVQRDIGTELEVDIAVGQGDVTTSIQAVGWEPGDLLFVGSSRIEHKRSVFVGSVAMRILRELTVPLVVVPRGYQVELEVI